MAEHSIDLVPNLLRGHKSNGRSMYHREAKRELVRRCLQPGVSLAATALAHGLNPNLLRKWVVKQTGRSRSGARAPKLLAVTALPVAATGSGPRGEAAGDGTGTVAAWSSWSLAARSGSAGGSMPSHCARCSTAWQGARDRTARAEHRSGSPPGVTDMRRGMYGLAALVETTLSNKAYSGQVFVFRGRRGDLIKVLWADGEGLCLFAKRLERGRFVWPRASSGSVHLTPAQLSMLLEGIDWRRPERTWKEPLHVV